MFYPKANDFYGNNTSYQNFNNNYIPNQIPNPTNYKSYQTGAEAEDNQPCGQNKAFANEKLIDQEGSQVNEDFFRNDNNEPIEDDETDKEIWFPKFQNCDCC